MIEALIFFVFVVSIVVGTIIQGYVLSLLWLWFIVPIFAIKSISIAQSIGLIIIAEFLTHQYQQSTLEKEQAIDLLKGSIKTLIITPLIMLAVGWIVKQFV